MAVFLSTPLPNSSPIAFPSGHANNEWISTTNTDMKNKIKINTSAIVLTTSSNIQFDLLSNDSNTAISTIVHAQDSNLSLNQKSRVENNGHL